MIEKEVLNGNSRTATRLDFINLMERNGRKYNIIDHLSYEACMKFYMDNSALEEYIERGKETACLGKKEIKFWEDAMQTGKVSDVLRSAIMEMHPEDRKNDPIDIRIARKTIKHLELNEETQKREDKNIKDTFSAIYFSGYLLKEIVKGKMKNPNVKVKDIVNETKENEDKIFEKADKKIQSAVDLVNGTIRDSNGVDIQKYKSFYKKTQLSKLVDDFDKTKINEYVEEYKKSKVNQIEQKEESINESVVEEEKKESKNKISGMDLGKQTTKSQENFGLKNRIQSFIEKKMNIMKTKDDKDVMKIGE